MSGILAFLDYATKGVRWVSSNDPLPVTATGGTGANAMEVQGSSAVGAPPTGNPVEIAARSSAGTTIVSLTANAPSDGASNASNGLSVDSRGSIYNGTSWDRWRSVTGSPTGTSATDMPLWVTSDLTQVRINNAGASGDTTLVAAVSGQTTRVHALRISVAGATIVQVKDGAGTVLEVFNFAGAGGNVVLDFSSRPHYKTSTNTAFIINSSAAVQVDGRAYYVTSA